VGHLPITEGWHWEEGTKEEQMRIVGGKGKVNGKIGLHGSVAVNKIKGTVIEKASHSFRANWGSRVKRGQGRLQNWTKAARRLRNEVS